MTPAMRLARWLGPWASEAARPRDVTRRSVRVDGRFEAWVYRPRRRPDGALLVIPGLHYLGPADERLDRFLTILAHSGIVVLAPFFPELRALRVGASLVPDAQAAWDALLALPDRPRGVRPGVFSISFGSYPAIHLAGAREIGALTLFGGYADFEDAIRFSLGGQPGRPFDPTNRPVLFMNLLPYLDGLPADRDGLYRLLTSYVRRTWGRPELKAGGWRDVARDLARRAPSDARALFEVATGLEPGSDEAITAALARAHGSLSHLEVRSACAQVRAPTAVVHGRDDDVIPYTHSEELATLIPGARLFLTGLYSHTGAGAVSPARLVDEGRAMLGILGAIAGGARTAEG